MKQTTFLLLLFLLSCNQAQQPAENNNVNNQEVKTEEEHLFSEPKTKIIPAAPTVFPAVKKLAAYPQTEFLMTLEHRFSKDKNAVYCVPIVYAWDGLRKYINAPLEIDKKWQDLVLLNDSKSFIDVLKPEEYKVEVKAENLEISAKAEFTKSLPFEFKMGSFDDKLSFGKTVVPSFGVLGQDSQIGILYYKNDENFLITLAPKDKTHQIILFKSEKKFDTMAKMFAEVEANIALGKKESGVEKLSWKYVLEGLDEVLIPKFKFNIETDYEKLIGNQAKAKNEVYEIIKAWQRTAFVLDEAGAEIQSEAEIVMTTESAVMEEETPRPKKMHFNKPFFVMLKRTDAKFPYFSMWVANTELMVKE